ncbi:hypothetical protein [Fodinicola feengrottensis]|uniref:hypothetical protein n=1 Tax=Fodinicola feengrottensis TaxID=435914 RepID=UPI002441BBDB|nr:hypothetical protein [Fodinicola feengrottensis]
MDGKRSYALIKTANGKYAVARTQDTGATWQAWQLPPPSMPTRNVPVLYVDQSDSLVVSASGPPSGTAKVSQDGKQVSVDGGKTWEANVGQLGQLISQDGGQTWRPSGLPGTTGRPIEKLAPGWSAQTSGGKVFGSDPAAGGALHPLVHQPQVATRCMGVTEAADESSVAGVRRCERRLRVAGQPRPWRHLGFRCGSGPDRAGRSGGGRLWPTDRQL